VRHGLERLCAAVAGIKFFELARENKESPPAWIERKPPTPKRAAAALDSFFGWHDAALRAPQVFLPKSGHCFVRKLDGRYDEAAIAAATKSARETWTGTQFDGAGRAEASPATRMALRGRDPFFDEDEQSLTRFKLLSVSLFGALGDATPLDPEAYA
jgi:exodeoxyribonuclease V gamma subunit